MTGYRLESPPVPFRRTGKRVTDRNYLTQVRSLPCLSCGVQGSSEASHVRMGSHRHGKTNPGIGRRPDDKWTVPQCHSCHMEMHATGERTYWEALRIDVIEVALVLWESRGDLDAMMRVVKKYQNNSRLPVDILR